MTCREACEKESGGNKGVNCCYKCAQFKILYEPIKSGGDIWDFGRAKCLKHDLIVDFPDHRKLKKLVCIEKGVNNNALDSNRPDTESQISI